MEKDVTSILHMTEWGEFTHSVHNTIEEATNSLAKLFKNNKRSLSTVVFYMNGRSSWHEIGWAALTQDATFLLSNFKWLRYYHLGWDGSKFLTDEERIELWSKPGKELLKIKDTFMRNT